MKNIKTFLLIALSQIILRSYSQTNPRLENAQYMETVFFEDFNGNMDSLRRIWNVASHYKRSLGFLVDNPLNINVQSGNLELKMRYVPNYLDSIWKSTGWQHIYSDYTCAEIGSKKVFRYGSFECYAKYAHEKASWPAFWMIGGDGTPCPPGGYGNEIDIAEFKCDDSDNTLDHVIHRYYPPANCDDSNHDQKDFYDYREMSFDNNYHLFKCIWSPDDIKYYVDGIFTHQVLNSGQEWYPNLYLGVILSQQVVDPIGAPVAPQTSYFDYVRIRQFFLAPEITLSSNIICSNGSALMDVDPAATNISWALTPASLFTGQTSGNGTTANITASSATHGKGKITYSFAVGNYGETFTAEKEIWINGPDYSEVSFDVYRSDGTHATKVGNTWLMCPNTTYHIYVVNNSPVPLSNYTWTIPSAWTRFYTYQNMISVNTNSSPGGQVSVSATNTATGCNNTIQIITGYMGSSYSCGSYFMTFTPNPATTETTVELSVDGDKILTEDTHWELEVYDQQQGLKEKKTNVKGKQTKINTTGWKDGTYIVRALIGEDLISDKLVIKH